MISQFLSKIKSNQWLVAVLGFAFVVRIFGVGYGLPFHFFGDEEALVFGALKMLELKTIVPAFHWEAFRQLLYYPPFLSYVYLIVFIPVLGIKYLLLGAPTLETLKNIVVADPSIFWYTARFLNVCFSLANIYVVYRIAGLLFKNKSIALLSALFLATSFIDVNVAFTARHWTATLFFSLLSLWFTLRALHEPDGAKFFSIAAGLSLGVSFGMGYLVFYLPVIGCLYLLWGKQKRLEIINNIFYFGSGFIALALLAITLHPQPFIQQVLVHTYAPPGVVKSISTFVWYYGEVLWNYETLLLVFAGIGLGFLLKKERKLFLIITAFYVIVGTIMYLFLWNIPRYITPLLPIFSLAAGYGAYSLAERGRSVFLPRTGVIVLVIGLSVYSTVVFVRFNTLVLKGDTRIEAKKWLETLDPNDSVVVYSGGVRPTPTKAALELQTKIAPGSLRSAETIYLTGILPIPAKAVNTFPLVFIQDVTTKKVIIEQAIHKYSGNHYIVTDSWLDPDETQQTVLANAVLVKEFIGSDQEAGYDSPDGNGTLFIGGEAHTVRRWLPKLLFTINQLGPTIYIYQL